MGDSWRDLIETIDRQERDEERRKLLMMASFINNTCDHCGKEFDGKHQTYEFRDNFGNLRRVCQDAPRPDLVTEEELAYVRRSILGEETA